MKDLTQMKSVVWLLLAVLLAAAAVNLIFFVMPFLAAYRGSFAPARQMTITAEGKTIAVPDLAEASFSVVAQGKNPQDLAAASNEKMSAVVSFLKSEGVADKDIKTTAYNLSPDYRYDNQTSRNYIVGYTMTQTVDVKMRDFDKVAAVLAGLTPLGANQIGNVSFTVEDSGKYLAIARADALRKASAEAGELAAISEMRLGRVVNIYELRIGPLPYSYAQGASFAAPAAVPLPSVNPGTEELTDQVTVVYELQ